MDVGKANLTSQQYRRMRILSTVTTSAPREHVLFVHAHPDDETIATGGTIATLLDAGAEVTLLTCTRGELGEVVPPELRHLAGQALGDYRESELAEAMAALHLFDFRFLGNEDARARETAPHRYLDSGMQWGPEGAEPLTAGDQTAGDPTAGDQSEKSEHASLTAVELDTVVSDIVEVIAEVQPTAIVSYNERGGYGHPDHVRAHEAAGTAAILMGVPFYTIVPNGQELPGDIRVDVRPVLERKRRALAAHRTQLTVHRDTIIHSGGQVEPIGEVEVFRATATPPEAAVDWAHLGIVGRVSVCVMAVILGGIVGIIGTVNYQIAWSIVSLAITALFLVGLRLFFATRVVAAFAAVGLLIAVSTLSQSGPGGSVLIPANTGGYLWAYGPLVIAFVVLAWPRFANATRATMGEGSALGKDVDSP